MNSLSKRNFINYGLRALLVAGLLLTTTASQAASPIYKSLFSDLAVSGYDTVAFFTDNKAIKGNSDFSLEHQDATWHFVSQENLDLFQADPEKFAPQYGGYCAWAVANDDLASGDPELWTLFNGKLYLNYDTDVLSKWLADKEALVLKGDKNWPAVL